MTDYFEMASLQKEMFGMRSGYAIMPSMTARVLSILFFLVWICCSFATPPALPPGTRFIMSHFKANSGGGDERLYISVSPEGVQWSALNNGDPVWQPVGWAPFTNVVRDPSIVFVNGFYWVAYTSGNYGKHASFGLVKSTNLLDWTLVGEISTAIPGATDPLTWGPFFFKDADDSVHLFVSISPMNGSVYNPIPELRTYEIHPLNSEFTAWSSPVAVQLPSTNTNEFWVWKESETYHAIYVDFTQGSPYRHITSTNLISGWSNPQLLGFATYEGGFVLKRPEGGYRVYLEGGNGNTIPGYFYYDYNDAFTAHSPAQNVSAQVPMRNGKVIAAPTTTAFADWQTLELSGLPSASQAATADPDGDGLSNLLECALGLSPQVPNASPVKSWFDGAGQLRARYAQAPNLSNVTVSLQISSDLLIANGWADVSGALSRRSVTLMSDGREMVEWADLAPPPHPAQGFFRLRALGP